jgi:periplasmic copper chaperone A
MNRCRQGLLPALAFALVLSAPVLATAQTTVTEAWVRGTVEGQGGTGLYARIVSQQGGRLVALRTPVAQRAEIHEMVMKGDVMQMRELAKGLELPAGKPVLLAPGGLHGMLIGLPKPLSPGQTVPVTFVVEGKNKQRETIELQVPVQMRAPAPAAAPASAPR